MADYTDWDVNDYLPGRPWTSAKAIAAFENPVAIAEGAPGAPSVLPNIGANVAAGAIGSYAFLRSLDLENYSFGDTKAGSRLVPSGVELSSGGVDSPASVELTILYFMPTQTGTWMCMGQTSFTDLTGSANDQFGTTLWVRVA